MHSRITTRGVLAAMLLALFGCAPSAIQPAGGSVPGLEHAIVQSSGPTFTAFTAGTTPGLPSTAIPRDIVAGANGVMWFTDIQTPAIGTISASLKIREFRTGLRSGAQPYSIVAGPDGNMWFSDEAGAIGRITSGGTITEFHAPPMGVAAPIGLTVGADNAIWAIGSGTSKSYLIRITVAGKISSFPIPQNLIPDGSIAADSKGNLWFFASRTNHEVFLVQRTAAGALIPYSTGLMTRGEPCCPNLAAKHIAIGADGNPWFTTPYFALPSQDGQHIGTFASGHATFFEVARGPITYPVYPSGIVAASHDLWYSGSDPISFNGALWRMDSSGHQFAYPIVYDPAGLAVAADDTLWFTSQAQGRPPQIVRAVF